MAGPERKKLSWLKRHRYFIRTVLLIIVVVCSLIGSSQYYFGGYYEGTLPSPLSKLSAVVNSTISLFLANPTVPLGERTPFMYEIARFIAPLLSTFCVYKLILEKVFRLKNVLNHLFNRANEMVIFGCSESSRAFIDTLYEENKRKQPWERRTFVLVSSVDIGDEERYELEKKDVYIHVMDHFLSETEGDTQRAERQNALVRLNFRKTKEIVFMENDETVNFALFGDFLALAKDIEPKHGRIRCSFCASSHTVRKAVSDLYDSYIKEGHDNLTLVLFSIPELEVLDMLGKHSFYEPVYHAVKEKAQGGTVSIQDIPDVHILIAGLGGCGLSVLEKAIQTGVLKNIENGRKNLTVTIIDRDENAKNKVKALFPAADEVCTLNFVNLNIERGGLELQLERYPQITYAAVCFSDQTKGWLMMERIRKLIIAQNMKHADDPAWLTGLCVPVAVRMESNNSFMPYLDCGASHPEYTVFDFGNTADIYTAENILRSSLDERAAVLNHRYQTLLKKIHDPYAQPKSPEEDWNALNYERRESNRAVVLNAPYFHEMIHLSGAAELLDEDNAVSAWDVSENGMLKKIEGTVIEDFVRLEHQRWCCFYISYGFAGACEKASDNRKYMFLEKDGKTVYGQVHNCLVDYETLKKTKERADTIHYDLANIYQYSRYTG